MSIIINGLDEHMRELEVIDHHFHNREIWYGLGAVEDDLAPYRITSGNGVFGSEIAILGAASTPKIAGKTRFDLHRIQIIDFGNNTLYYLRIIWGLGTVEDAETDMQYSTTPVQAVTAGAIGGAPSGIMFERGWAGKTKVWAKVKNTTNSATLDILVGSHEYDW